MKRYLKPCPFCGSRNLLICQVLSHGAFVSCANCDTLGPNAPTQEAAKNKWNTRTTVKEVSHVA